MSSATRSDADLVIARKLDATLHIVRGGALGNTTWHAAVVQCVEGKSSAVITGISRQNQSAFAAIWLQLVCKIQPVLLGRSGKKAVLRWVGIDTTADSRGAQTNAHVFQN